MIEINSEKINDKELLKEIKETFEFLKEHPYRVSFPVDNNTLAEKNILPSVQQMHPKIYIILKKCEHILYSMKLNKIISILKPIIKKMVSKQNKVYLIDDFTQYHDSAFITNAFTTILKRKPTKKENDSLLDVLLSGKMSKTEILANIKYSTEGKKNSSKILGLKKRYILFSLYKIPLLGIFIKTCINLAFITRLYERYNRFEAFIFLNNKKIETAINEIKTSEKRIEEQLNILQGEINKKVNLDDFFKELNSFSQSEITTEKKYLNLSSEVNTLKLYIRELDSYSKQLQVSTDTSEKITNISSMHTYDDFYISFEDKFRGSKENIKTRQQYYIPYVKQVVNDVNDIVVDLGCGRGEWLELLKENDILAYGVDLNRLMVSQAKQNGLNAQYQDALTYLHSLTQNSIAAVTGFHIVEHLDFELLLNLFDAAYKALKKGGMIIFETPNPENLFVGASSFYTDPTHKNPIPPASLQFIAENRAFENVSIHKLNPLKEAHLLDGDSNEDVNMIISAAMQAQDYAIIGYK